MRLSFSTFVILDFFKLSCVILYDLINYDLLLWGLEIQLSWESA